jgi:hypothetical protein
MARHSINSAKAGLKSITALSMIANAFVPAERQYANQEHNQILRPQAAEILPRATRVKVQAKVSRDPLLEQKP